MAVRFAGFTRRSLVHGRSVGRGASMVDCRKSRLQRARGQATSGARTSAVRAPPLQLEAGSANIDGYSPSVTEAMVPALERFERTDTEENVALYARRGYEVMARQRLSDSGGELVAMRRRVGPRPQAGPPYRCASTACSCGSCSRLWPYCW